jgi:uncharacterized protein YktA (UPF0223 family)
MAISIYKLFRVTYNDYICDYDRYLSEFLKEYEDNTELYFIKEQKSILDNHLVKFKEVVMNLVEEDENKEEIIDLFRNRINTTDRIKAFLESRKQQLEKESNSIVPVSGELIKNNSMYTSAIHFYESAIKGLVSELDILNFIDEATKNQLPKLEALQKDLEEFEINFTVQEVVESYFSEQVRNSISISEKFIMFKEIVLSKIEEVKIKVSQEPESQYKISGESVEPKQVINNTKNIEIYISKPCFKEEAIESIILTLNPYFDSAQHLELKRIIENGSKTNDKLLFRESGNKLSDFFKHHFEIKNITGCDKTFLIGWIVQNFKFVYRKQVRDFNPKTVEKTISSKDNLCKNPII